MKKINVILIIFALMLLALPLASAGIADDVLWSFNFNDADLSGDNPTDGGPLNINATNHGATTGVSGPTGCGEAFSYSTVGGMDYVNTANYTESSIMTMSLWFNNDNDIGSAMTSETLIMSFANGPYGGIQLGPVTGSMSAETFTATNTYAGTGFNFIKDSVLASSGWNHYAVRWNANTTTYDQYINGVKKTNFDYLSVSVPWGAKKWSFGARKWNNDRGFNGDIDQAIMYSTVKTLADLRALGAVSGTCVDPFAGGAPPSTNFTITNSDGTTNFNITWSNGTVDNSGTNAFFVSDINQTSADIAVTLDMTKHEWYDKGVTNWNSSVNLNFTLTKTPILELVNLWNGSNINGWAVVQGVNYSVNKTGLHVKYNGTRTVIAGATDYFTSPTGSSYSFLNENNAKIWLKQSHIKFDTYEILTGNNLTGVTYNVDGNTTSWYLNTGNYNVTASKAGYFNRIYEFTVNARDNKTVNITDMSSTVINLTAADAINATVITNFTGWLYHYNTSTNISFTTTTGSYQIPSASGELFLLHMEGNGQYATTEVNITPDATIYNYTIQVYIYNSIYITFRDEVSKALINNVSLDLISSVFSNNYTTTTGTMYIKLLTPEGYTMRYNSQGYNQRFFYQTIMNDNSYQLTLYLLQGGVNVTATVIDQTGSFVSSAIIKALRYDLATNTYNIVSMGETDNDGETILDLETNGEFYRFIIQLGGETLLFTDKQQITSNEILFSVTIGQDDLELYKEYSSIDYDLVFLTASNTFRLIYNDALNIAGEFCLNTYHQRFFGDDLLFTDCQTTQSGTIMRTITPLDGQTYYSVATTTIGGKEFNLGKVYYSHNLRDMGKNGIFLQLLITLVACATGFLFVEAIPIAIPLSLFVGQVIGLHSLGFTTLTALFITGLIIAFLIGNRNG